MIEGLGDLFRDPNGDAYQAHEERDGPPLSYVQEKLGNSVRAIQQLGHALWELQAQSARAAQDSADSRDPYWTAYEALYYGLVAYLALSNMLALANDSKLVERLIALDPPRFDDWLRGIEEGGSVVG